MRDDVTSIRCYIEHYDAPSGRRGLRLREKDTTRRVVLGSTRPAELQQFLQFLVAGEANRAVMPALFDPSDERDCVLVSGQLASTTASTVTFVYNDMLSYLFA